MRTRALQLVKTAQTTMSVLNRTPSPHALPSITKYLLHTPESVPPAPMAKTAPTFSARSLSAGTASSQAPQTGLARCAPRVTSVDLGMQCQLLAPLASIRMIRRPLALIAPLNTTLLNQANTVRQFLLAGNQLMSLADVVPSKCVPPRPTVNGVKLLAPHALMDSYAPSKRATRLTGSSVALVAPTALVVSKPSVLPASTVSWREVVQKLRLALTAPLASIACQELSTSS